MGLRDERAEPRPRVKLALKHAPLSRALVKDPADEFDAKTLLRDEEPRQLNP